MEWQDKIEYYTIVTNEQLDTVVPDMVVEFMNYDKTKVHTLRTACFPFPQELEDGRFLINIQLVSHPYYNNKDVKGFITQDGFNLAVMFYGIENIFTNVSGLKFKEEIINN